MTDGFHPRVIEERIRAYEGFGIHRTGWTGDDASASWMRDVLHAAGLDPRLERFNVPLVEVRRARLLLPDGAIEGVPLFDAGFTPAGGIEAELVEFGDADIFGNIVVTRENDSAFGQAGIGRQLEDLEEAGAVGLVIVSADPKGAVKVLNAASIASPRKLPALQIGVRDSRALASVMLLRTEVRLEIDADRLQSRARNVVSTLPGSDPEAAPLGIMTPRSGWFTCAAERGGGIAILLALAEALAKRPRRRSIEFVASSGHELNHAGLAAYLKERPGIEARAHAWLHLGANIGASTGPVYAESVAPALEEQARQALEAAGARFEVITARGGEAQNIARGGGRYISFRGKNDYFHSPNDLFDLACDAELVAAAGRAALAIIEAWLEA